MKLPAANELHVLTVPKYAKKQLIDTKKSSDSKSSNLNKNLILVDLFHLNFLIFVHCSQ